MQLLRALSNIFYPAFCLHCDYRLDDGAGHLCSACQRDLAWIDPSERCLYCCSADVSLKTRVCSECLKSLPFFHRAYSVLDDVGPARALRNSLKNGNSYLAKGAAAYLAYQWGLLEWPMPDCITFVPFSFSRRIQQGYNRRELLALELGKILDRPVKKLLKRTSAETEGPSFKSLGNIKDQNVLLIDDLWVSGATMRAAAEALQELSPAGIYGLTLCRSMM